MTYDPARGRPTGFRQVSHYSIQAEDLARSFEGLEQDCRRGDVLSAFKRAAAYLGISPRLRDAIDLLFSYSQAVDWERGARPIVWPSNQVLQDELCLCRRSVQYLLRDLEEAGLVATAESPSGKRYGMRDNEGRIVEAYGIDLSPLACRREEFLDAAAAARALREERGRLRRRITIARKATLQIAQAGHETAPEAADWDAYAVTADELGQAAARLDHLPDLQRRAERLEALQGEAEVVFRAVGEMAAKGFSVDGAVCTAPEGATDCARTELQSTPPILVKNTRRETHAWQEKSSAEGEAEQTDRRRRCGTVESVEEDLATHKISPAFVAKIFGELDLGHLTDRPGWSDVVDAAYFVRHGLGISEDAWRQACMTMGRSGAAVAVAIIAAKAGAIRSPGGYLRGMIAQARLGRLRLGPSIYKVRDLREAG